MTKHTQLVRKAENPNLLLADICLYGIRQTGAGWLAARRDGRTFGTGDPVQGRTFTEAVFQAVDAVLTGNRLGLVSSGQVGLIRVFHPGGETMTILDLQELVPTYGDMTRVPVTVHTGGVCRVSLAVAGEAGERFAAKLNAMPDADLKALAAEMDALAPIDARD